MAKSTQVEVTEKKITPIPVSDSDLLKKELEDTKKNFADAMAEIEKMKTLLVGVNAGMGMNQKAEDREIQIGCRLIRGTEIYSEKGDFAFQIKLGEVKKIRESKLKFVFENSKMNFKKYFETDVLYFIDEAEYQNFDIDKNMDLSDEGLIDVVKTDDYNKMITKLGVMTKDKRSDYMVHTIVYHIGMLCAENKLNDWNYTNRANFEQYFGIHIDQIINNLDSLKALDS